MITRHEHADWLGGPGEQPPDAPARQILGVTESAWVSVEPTLDATAAAACRMADFHARAGQVCLAPDHDGALREVYFGLGDGSGGAMAYRALPKRLSAGSYRLTRPVNAEPGFEEAAVVAWGLGAYRFDRYRSKPAPEVARIVDVPTEIERRARAIVGACALARDMVNTPANDMGPAEIAQAANDLATAHGAGLTVTGGAELLSAGYPAVHAVGRAATGDRAPRFVELSWGATSHRHLVIIGKGVSFDTGGLDLKPSSGMRWMKKDMGGAAHALALGSMIMTLGLPIRLTVLIPAVENAVGPDAMRPGDVLATRKGLSVEVGNTDAEGRLILADALTRADELKPDLTLDLATLTGAARVALGPQVVPFFTPDDRLAAKLAAASSAVQDPLWRMPLWKDYAPALESDIADIKNDPDAWAQAGSVTAALFLQRFAPAGPWAHFDIFAWNARARPGWPTGAEAQAIRAIFAMLEAWSA